MPTGLIPSHLLDRASFHHAPGPVRSFSTHLDPDSTSLPILHCCILGDFFVEKVFGLFILPINSHIDNLTQILGSTSIAAQIKQLVPVPCADTPAR